MILYYAYGNIFNEHDYVNFAFFTYQFVLRCSLYFIFSRLVIPFKKLNIFMKINIYIYIYIYTYKNNKRLSSVTISMTSVGALMLIIHILILYYSNIIA